MAESGNALLVQAPPRLSLHRRLVDTGNRRTTTHREPLRLRGHRPPRQGKTTQPFCDSACVSRGFPSSRTRRDSFVPIRTTSVSNFLTCWGSIRYRTHPTFSISVGEDSTPTGQMRRGGIGRSFRKAEKSGSWSSFNTVQSLVDQHSGFRTIDDATMERVGASGRVESSACSILRSPGRQPRQPSVRSRPTLDGSVCASAIFMVWGDRVHYHLSGSTSDGLRAGCY